MSTFSSEIYFADMSVGIDPTAGLDYDSARQATPRFWGVSFGDGNDGVSRMYPNYIVRAADPWFVATVAVLENIHYSLWDWALADLDVDGEPEFGLSATLLEGPTGETAYGAAWMILEVFEIDGPSQYDCQFYDSPAAAFSKDAMAMVRAFGGE